VQALLPNIAYYLAELVTGWVFGGLGRLGEQGLHLIFKFRELDGERLLYEENQRLYFKR
jgi:hypothetical protein